MTERMTLQSDTYEESEPLWSQQQAVNFEAAQELLTKVIGCWHGVLEEERVKGKGEDEHAKEAKAHIKAAWQAKRNLRPGDDEHVAAIRSEYSEEFNKFMQEM